MESPARLRRRIRDAIASASGGAKGGDGARTPSPVDVGSLLDEIFASPLDGGGGDGDGDDDANPLMVACYKRCSAALDYLRNQMEASVSRQSPGAMPSEHLAKAWGHPADVNSCGNGAAHNALAAGFCEGLDALEHAWGCIEGEPRRGRLRRYLSLLSQTNQNGDTPPMMACVSGHAAAMGRVLGRVLSLGARPDDADASIRETWQSLRKIFNAKNNEGCTTLNLACGYERIDVVQLLVQENQIQIFPDGKSLRVKFLWGDDRSQKRIGPADNTQVYNLKSLIEVSYADIDGCQKTVDNMAAYSEQMKQSGLEGKIAELDAKLKKVRGCLALMECEMERISTDTANELMMDSEGQASQSEQKKSGVSSGGTKPKGRAKKKKKQKRNKIKRDNINSGVMTPDDGRGIDEIDDGRSIQVWGTTSRGQETKADADPSPMNHSPFITLQDGSVVSKSQKVDYAPFIQADNSAIDAAGSNEPGIAKPKSLQSILQSTSIKSSTSGDLAAIMESLCLDPSMLLLSPHGMAMETSPCQLDAIESILNHQLEATKEARRIQNRLLVKKK